jgi:Flp pilus assembly protein TadD
VTGRTRDAGRTGGHDLGIVLGLAALCIAVFGRVASFPFVNFDDPAHIVDNPAVRAGLSLEGLRHAFTDTADAGWIPLTWLSRLLDVTLFGMNAGAHHLVNLLFHILCATMLFLFLRRATGRRWESALVAALFAVHPLHVESVAWVIERKDVLSTFFGLLALDAYASGAGPSGERRIARTALFLLLGLMSKPILVTLPFLLLLLDAWPLGRMRIPGAPSLSGSSPIPLRRLLVEKIPLFALSALFCVVTLAGQGSENAIASLDSFPVGTRIANALASAATYLWKTVFPAGLAAHYPHPGATLPAWKVALSAATLAGSTLFAVLQARSRPWIAVGWFWYLGTLVPVLGLVQAGSQGMADRCTYIPLIGIFVVVAWGGSGIASRLGLPPAVRAAAAAACLAALSVLSFVQAGYWRSSTALFEHAIEVTRGNYLAHNQLGHALMREGRTAEAIAHFREALRINPDYPDAHHNLGDALRSLGQDGEAIAHYREAVRLAPGAESYNNLGVALMRTGAFEEGIARFREAVRIRPGYAGARNNLGIALLETGRDGEAESQFREAVRVDPAFADAWNNLGIALARRGAPAEARACFETAVRLSPGHPGARANLERTR